MPFHWPTKTNCDYLYMLAAWTPRRRSWWRWAIYYDKRTHMLLHWRPRCCRIGLPLIGCVEIQWQD